MIMHWRHLLDFFCCCRHCETIIRYQTHYRVNEALGRYGAEELRVRVQWWSFAEALIIMCSGLGQVLILKTFFTDRHAKKPRAQSGTNPMPPLSTPPLGAPPLSTPPLLLPTNKLWLQRMLCIYQMLFWVRSWIIREVIAMSNIS